MGLNRDGLDAALVVPDEETWLAFGTKRPKAGPAPHPASADLVVLPEHVPRALVEPVQSAWYSMSSGRSSQVYEVPWGGIRAEAVLEASRGEEGGDGQEQDAGGEEHDGHGDGHGGEDDHDMMAITGEPSADDLVMEDLDVQAGPLGFALPGGLVVEATLDGDVVAHCRVRPTLRIEARGHPPDPWSAMAWNAAELAARERSAGAVPAADRWLRLAAIELERAVSHLAWLHGFCRLLGWDHVTARVRRLVVHLVPLQAGLPVELVTPDLSHVATTQLRDHLRDRQAAAVALAGTIRKSRSFGRRTDALGQVDRDAVVGRRLAGPVARGSGVGDDARAEDEGYALLGFEPTVLHEGDARARTMLRLAEVAQALELAAAALERAPHAGCDGEALPQFGRPPGGMTEAARGPVHVTLSGDGEPQRVAPSIRPTLQAAGELAVGREWAAALVTVASFDLSAWRVGP